MSDIGNKVVFIIEPCEGSSIIREQWSKTVRHSVLKILHYFNEPVGLKSSSVQDVETKELKWAYKFMNTRGQKVYRAKQDLKDFNAEEFSFFEDEVRYIAMEEKEQSREETILPGGAHALSEELMSIVHDYTWETSNIISPVKRTSKRQRKSFPGNKKRLSKENLKRKYCGENYSLRSQKQENHRHNFVVLLCPLPLDQPELDRYFEWHIDSVEFVSNKLMPSHLSAHFREKHNITLAWVDTRLSRDWTTLHDEAGLEIMEMFLSSIDGCLLPSTLLAANSLTKPGLSSLVDDVFEDCFPTSYTSASVKIMGEIFPTSCLLDHFFKRFSPMNQEDSINTVHVCRRKITTSGAFQIEKLWSLKLAPLNPTSSGIKSLLCQPCTLCLRDYIPDEVDPSKQLCEVSFHPSDMCHTVVTQTPHTKISFLDKVNIQQPKMDARPESVFIIVGAVPIDNVTQIIENVSLQSLNAMSCTIISDENGNNYTSKLDTDSIYVMKMHKYCTACGSEPCVDHCSTSRYALLQVISRAMAIIVWLSSSSGVTILKLLQSESWGWMDHSIAPSQESTVIDDMQQDIEYHSDKKSSLEPQIFSTSMLERWFPAVALSNNNLEIPTNGIRKHMEENSIHSEIVAEIQKHYQNNTKMASKSSEASKTVQEKEKIPEMQKIPVCNEFESEESMVSALKEEYSKALESTVDSSSADVPPNFCGFILQTAQSIVSVLFHHAHNRNDSNWKSRAESLVKKYFVCTAADIRKRNAESDNGKLQESILQILLLLELASQIPLGEESTEITAENITSFLRLISLSANPATMYRCLTHVFVENYASTCGELLCEVYNELMQPVPLQLQPFAKNASEDSYFMSSSVKTVQNSIQSSNPPSLCSSGGPESYNRKPARSFKSFPSNLSRQIEVPGAVKYVKQASSKNSQDTKSSENIKHRLRSSTKKEKPGPVNGAKEVGRVKRDLFAASDGEKKDESNKRVKSLDSVSGDIKPLRKMTVSDTPDAKQRLTALSRQRLRLRREKQKEVTEEMLEVIEESPAKFDDGPTTHVPELKRSPRHKIMMTRRHSFYREGKQSRTVARAKIIQQHQEAAPATPVALRKDKQNRLADIDNNVATFSPNSLLFVRNTQNMFSPTKKTDQSLVWINDSPAKNTRSHATKALFQSPVREMKTPTRQSQREAHQQVDVSSVGDDDNVVIKEEENLFFVGIQPILPSPLKTPQKPLPNFCVNTPVKGAAMPPPAVTPAKKSARKLMPENFGSPASRTRSAMLKSPERAVTPQKLKQEPIFESCEIDSDSTCNTNAINTTEKSNSSELAKMGTMDAFVIRTPFSNPKGNTGGTRVRQTKKRKWSLDTTPTRDDINQWPRKKRGVDKSSPGVVTKKSKKTPGTSPTDKDRQLVQPKSEIIFQDNVFDCENIFGSPDTGLVILEDHAGSSKGEAKSFPAMKNMPPLREIGGHGTDSNENIIQRTAFRFEEDPLKLPPTPKLRLGVSRHRLRTSNLSCKQGSNSLFNTDITNEQDPWDDVYSFESNENTTEMIQTPKNGIKDTVELSARSLLHIQNSPILTPQSKRQRASRTQSVK